MNKTLSIMAIAIALCCGACAKAPATSSESSNDQAFPASLQFQQPAGVK